ncbi:hypothetical protein QBC34DRAFT_420434 [Podospora aff. communis PSN243]|uniref:Uncharacterized protein n=1 Tax=Podospora aff. communis PSN243 TaxID=3040156 RepID=A0AAV9H4U2_9PEZI|nr:hypothetical protein QBC34DRAFT_420434 [Podospora aff. communis PSN243]
MSSFHPLLTDIATWPAWDRAFQSRVHRLRLDPFIFGTAPYPETPSSYPFRVDLSTTDAERAHYDANMIVSWIEYHELKTAYRDFWQKYHELASWMEDTVAPGWQLTCFNPKKYIEVPTAKDWGTWSLALKRRARLLGLVKSLPGNKSIIVLDTPVAPIPKHPVLFPMATLHAGGPWPQIVDQANKHAQNIVNLLAYQEDMNAYRDYWRRVQNLGLWMEDTVDCTWKEGCFDRNKTPDEWYQELVRRIEKP